MNEVDGFDRARCGLPEARLETWQGFVFVNLDGEAKALAPQLTELAPYFEQVAASALVEVDVLEYESTWNWKVMVENFMESYHHMGAHAKTLQPTNPARGTHGVEHEDMFEKARKELEEKGLA